MIMEIENYQSFRVTSRFKVQYSARTEYNSARTVLPHVEATHTHNCTEQVGFYPETHVYTSKIVFDDDNGNRKQNCFR